MYRYKKCTVNTKGGEPLVYKLYKLSMINMEIFIKNILLLNDIKLKTVINIC